MLFKMQRLCNIKGDQNRLLWLVDNGLKEVVVVYFKELSQHSTRNTDENRKTSVSLADVRTGYLQNSRLSFSAMLTCSISFQRLRDCGIRCQKREWEGKGTQ